MTDIQTSDLFTKRMKPRIAALETYAQQLKQLKQRQNQSDAFREGIKITTDMLNAQTELYQGITNLRELQIIAPDGDEKIAQEMGGITAMLDALKNMR